MTTFDLNTRKAKDSITFDVMDPVTKTATGMTITLASKFSKQAKAMQYTIANAQLARQQGDKLTAELLDAQLLDLLAQCTLAWDGFVVGEAMPVCTPENVKAIYENPQTAWIRDQAQEKYLDTAGFFDSASSNSAPTPDITSVSAA
jgi:hypothetical protein